MSTHPKTGDVGRSPTPSTPSQAAFQSRPFNESDAPENHEPIQAKSDAIPTGHQFGKIPLFAQTGVQAQLTVGAPDDAYEQEADRVANQVVNMPAPAPPLALQPQLEGDLQTKPLVEGITPLVQRQELSDDDDLNLKPDLQRSGQGSFEAGEGIEQQLNQSRGGGTPLSEEVRSFMEPRFGADFSQVRVHTSSQSVQMNRDLGAQAFTQGSDVYFGAGKYDPSSQSGKQLLAHELTHVVQQTGAVQAKPDIGLQSSGPIPVIMRDGDGGTPATTTAPPATTTDGGATPAAPGSMDLQAFLGHGNFGPQALVPPDTRLGGFDATYNPQNGQLLIVVRTGIRFENGLALDGSNTITSRHGDLAQAATDGMNLPPDQRATFVADFVWTEAQKQPFIDNLQSRVEGAWGTAGTGHSFVCTRSGWEQVQATVAVDVDVHEGTAGSNDHLQTTVYKVPDSGTYTVGAFVDSDRNSNGSRDTDAHNNALVMSSTHVNATPERLSLLRREVRFGHNSAVLTAGAQATLRGFAADFQDANLDLTNPVHLIGHASSSGSTEYNERLAQQRIDAVKTFLSSIGFTGMDDRVSTENQGEAGAAEADEWRRVDLIVGSGAGQQVAVHEFGHVFGLDDEYVPDAIRDANGNIIQVVNPGGTINGTGLPVGTAVSHDRMARDIGARGAIAENNDGIMSLGNTIRPQHYATFGWALRTVTGVNEWRVT